MASAPIPATIANDIFNEMWEYILHPHKKIDTRSLKWLRLKKNVDNLKKNSPIEGYLLQAILHALNHNLRSMEECFNIIKNNGGYPNIIFYQIICLFYNGLNHRILKELKLLQSDISKLPLGKLTIYIQILTNFGMNRTLISLLEKLKKLDIKISDSIMKRHNLNHVLKHFDEDRYAPILAEATTYLFNNKIETNIYVYEYDEEQQAIFIEYFIIFYNENGDEIELSEKDFIDFDIKFQKHWINYAAQKNLDTDNLILSLTPFGYLSDSEISELKGNL